MLLAKVFAVMGVSMSYMDDVTNRVWLISRIAKNYIVDLGDYFSKASIGELNSCFSIVFFSNM